jgi:hypothetical protein
MVACAAGPLARHRRVELHTGRQEVFHTYTLGDSVIVRYQDPEGV